MAERTEEIFKLLEKLALTTDHPTAKLAACITYKRKFISFGVNRMKSHPFQMKYSRNDSSIFIHAEIAVIKNALRELSLDELRKSTLYVCRVRHPSAQDHSYVSGLARPCQGCMRAIVEFGIPRVIFTTDEPGVYGEL